jgi:uncharacterized protein YjbI with pentapeptide repeats
MEEKNMANLLSKINIGGVLYDLKDAYAREQIALLLEDAAKHMDSTGIYADDAAVKKAIEDGDKAVRDYVDAQVGSINKFDVRVLGAEENRPAASADTMYILFLEPEEDAASGHYIEYITVRKGEEDNYTYEWEAIGSTKMDVTGFVTESALSDALKPYAKTEDLGDLAAKDESDLDLKALAHKNSATGTVAGETISGVKATGTSTGSINVALTEGEAAIASTGKFTPAGNVTGTVDTAGSINVTAKHTAADAILTKGDYTPAGSVTADFSHTATAATLTKGDYTPAGSVSVALSGATFKAIESEGTAASFEEGAFTAATLEREDVSATYVENAFIAEVGKDNESETLILTRVEPKTITATKVNAFTGGSKAADKFTPNTPAKSVEQTVGVQSASFSGDKAESALVTGVSYDKAALANLAFAGTKAEGALVTGVSYDKADIDKAEFTGATVDIKAAFAGSEGDIAVSGNGKTYAVDAANTKFNGAAIELAVGDIKVAAKDVTVQ